MEDSTKKETAGLPHIIGISTLLWPYPAPVYTNKAGGVELMLTLTSLWALCVCVTELMASDTGGGAGLASNKTDGGRRALPRAAGRKGCKLPAEKTQQKTGQSHDQQAAFKPETRKKKKQQLVGDR